MNKRKKFLSVAAAAALGLAGLIGAAAPAANASVASFTVANCQSALNNQTFTAATGTTALRINFTGTSCQAITPAIAPDPRNPPNFSIGTTAVPAWNSTDIMATPEVSVVDLGTNPTAAQAAIQVTNNGQAIPEGTYRYFYAFYTVASGLNPDYAGEFTIVVGGGGGDNGSSSSAAAVPQTFELSITPTDGTTCANSAESGRAGTWMTLPAANDCTAPESMPNAALLGWATIPNFPVDIAQRQVDNGWGAYEIFNEEGQLTAVFIPAGMPTFLSAPGKIYPIWKM